MPELSEKTWTILTRSRVEGLIIRLPSDLLERGEYTAIATALRGIGGKWNRKAQGFIFDSDPTALLTELQTTGKPINLQKQFQTFYTPAKLARRMAEILDPQIGDKITEPEAGRGALIQAVFEIIAPTNVHMDAFELMPENIERLKNLWQYPAVKFIGEDFLNAPADYKTNKVIANPPFSNNQDIDHILKMWAIVPYTGRNRIVTVASTAWITGQREKQVGFRLFVKTHAQVNEELPRGTFSKSGTEVPARLLVFDK